jgi:hypothetical protein
MFLTQVSSLMIKLAAGDTSAEGAVTHGQLLAAVELFKTVLGESKTDHAREVVDRAGDATGSPEPLPILLPTSV